MESESNNKLKKKKKNRQPSSTPSCTENICDTVSLFHKR